MMKQLQVVSKIVKGWPYDQNSHVKMTYKFFLQTTPYKPVPTSLE
jgi:hypothetical protein